MWDERVRIAPSATFFLVATLAGCAGEILGVGGENDSGGETLAPPGDAQPPGSRGTNGEWTPRPLEDDAAVSPIIRLRQSEYAATVGAAFAGMALPNPELPTDGNDNIFRTNAFDELGDFRPYVDTAEELASAVAQELLPQCDWAAETDSCVRSELLPKLEILYRRQLGDEEVTRQAQRIRSTLDSGSPLDVAVSAMLAEALLDFRFVFREELGQGPPTTPTRSLTDEELAARLSYVLVGQPPDTELRAIVASGQLRSEIQAQVTRLFAMPEAETVVWNFVSDWLALPSEAPPEPIVEPPPPPMPMDECNTTGECRNMFGNRATDCVNSQSNQSWCNCGGERCNPTTPPPPPATGEMGLAASAYEETRRFVRHVMFSGDVPLSDLFTANYSFINAMLAEHYGVEPPTTEWERYEFEPSAQRMGILTQALFLTANGREERDISWIFRGKVVYERLFCGEFFGLPAAGTTDREVIDRMTTPECAGCHTKMDPIGRLFDQYDSHGAVVASDLSSFNVAAGSDVDGEYSALTDFLAQAGTSQALDRCVSKMWFRYALGREMVHVDQNAYDSLTRMVETGAASDALTEIFRTDAFQTVHSAPAICQ